MRTGSIYTAVSKALELAAYDIRHGNYASVPCIMSFSGAEQICLTEHEYPRTAFALSVVTDRAKALYFTAGAALDVMGKLGLCDTEMYSMCRSVSIESLLLLGCRSSDNKKSDIYKIRKTAVLAKADKCISDSRHARFSAITKHGKIFLALPEIDCICKCCDTAERARKLIAGFDFALNL